MPILDNNTMKMIIMDHYANPHNKRKPNDVNEYKTIHMSSDNCIDDITLYLKEKDGVITQCLWDGVACTISTASTDIMCDLVVDKTTSEANNIIDNYLNMIHEQPFDEEVLDEAIVFINTSKQAARIRCATIGWTGLKELIEDGQK